MMPNTLKVASVGQWLGRARQWMTPDWSKEESSWVLWLRDAEILLLFSEFLRKWLKPSSSCGLSLCVSQLINIGHHSISIHSATTIKKFWLPIVFAFLFPMVCLVMTITFLWQEFLSRIQVDNFLDVHESHPPTTLEGFSTPVPPPPKVVPLILFFFKLEKMWALLWELEFLKKC